MSAFLAHLAGIALGAPARGAARLSLPPRFASPAASDAWPEGLAIEEAFGGAPPAAPPAAEPRRRSDALAPEAVPIQAAAAPAAKSAAPAPKSAAPAPKSAAPVPKSTAPAGETSGPPHATDRPMRAAAFQPAAPPPVIDRVAIQSPIAAPASRGSRRRADDPRLPPALAPALPGEVRVAAARPDSKPRVPPQRTVPPAAARERPLAPLSEWPFAPLSERALAGRTEPSRQAEPVIHVTIDRIDVRAPAAARPASAARRPPAEPSVSLADFLRGGSRTSQ